MVSDSTRDPTCIFCRILAGEAEASFVYRGEQVSAFMDLMPVSAGHLLVVPHQHAPQIDGVSEAALREMFSVGRALAGALRRSGLPCEGVNLYLADGPAAGQVVPHSHLHVIPRYAGDSCGLRLHAGGARPQSREALDAVAARLRAALAE